MHGGGIKVFYGSPYNKKIYIFVSQRPIICIVELDSVELSLVKLFNLKVRL